MSPLLVVHIGAGTIGIVSGGATVSVRKGGPLHRAFGTVFFLSVLIMATLGAYLAVYGPQPTAGPTPPKASVAVGLLTLYLVTTAWMTARRRAAGVVAFDYAALFVVLAVTTALVTFGLQAQHNAPNRPGGYAPYFVFAGFAAVLCALDVTVIVRGGVSDVQRIARHLWRMCFGLFFAAAFFFLGQQKVMPKFIQGSPLLIALAIAPLVLMVFWLVRVRLLKQPMVGVAAQGR
jgi:hypothetical protein